MKTKRWVWILYIPLFLFSVVMFYIEVSSYSLLPSDQGGMSFWIEFKNVWYRSLWFYGSLLLLISFLLYLFQSKGE
jgi:hypothetical protein